MEQVLMVSYDLVNPGQNYEELLRKIKTFKSWARLGGSAYLIYTGKTPVEVRDYLGGALDLNDKLYVGVASVPSAWRGMPDDVSTWIRRHQK